MYDVTCDVRGLKDMLKKHGDGRFGTVPWGERSRMTLKSNSVYAQGKCKLTRKRREGGHSKQRIERACKQRAIKQQREH